MKEVVKLAKDSMEFVKKYKPSEKELRVMRKQAYQEKKALKKLKKLTK